MIRNFELYQSGDYRVGEFTVDTSMDLPKHISDLVNAAGTEKTFTFEQTEKGKDTVTYKGVYIREEGK